MNSRSGVPELVLLASEIVFLVRVVHITHFSVLLELCLSRLTPADDDTFKI